MVTLAKCIPPKNNFEKRKLKKKSEEELNYYGKALKNVTEYLDVIKSIRDSINRGKYTEKDQLEKMRIQYECKIRPTVNKLKMQEPGLSMDHTKRFTFENPMDLAIKNPSFLNINHGIDFLDSLVGRIKLKINQHYEKFPS